MDIEDSKFEDRIKQILERLDELCVLMKAKNRLHGENILDNQDLCMLLNLTPRSIQRYRTSGELPFMRIGGKPFYLESEVYKFIKSRKQNKLLEEEAGDEFES